MQIRGHPRLCLGVNPKQRGRGGEREGEEGGREGGEGGEGGSGGKGERGIGEGKGEEEVEGEQEGKEVQEEKKKEGENIRNFPKEWLTQDQGSFLNPWTNSEYQGPTKLDGTTLHPNSDNNRTAQN